MPRNMVWCTFGTFRQNYDAITPESFCDFAFIPLYARNTQQDTLLDDSHADVQKMLGLVPKAPRTQFGISYTHRKNAEVAADISNPVGQSKLGNYWASGIYHHAVLDLEVKPWQGVTIRDEVRKAFDLLKALRAVQMRLNTSHPSAKAPHGGYIVLGFRIWLFNKVHFLGNVTEQMHQFAVDGLVPWTHFTEDEFEAKYPKCVITGASPLNSTNNNHTMDMVQVMNWVNSSTSWNIHPSLAISVSMCTRVYLTTKGKAAQYGDTCRYNNTPPGTSATYCNDYRKLYLTFDIEPTQLVTYASFKDYNEYMSTFETQSAVTQKVCEVKVRYKQLNISLALFDIECEDWQNECTNADSNVVQGTSRMRNIYQYATGIGRTAASLLNRSDNSCP